MDPHLLRVLSLDGGGIRGLSSLLILGRLMEEVRQVNGLDQVPKPCEWFDLIGGTSTGGIIAIMLGKLGMTVDECILAYKKVAQQAFTPKSRAIIPGRPSGAFSAKQLEAAIKQTVREYCIDPDCVQQRKRGQPSAETCPHSEMQFRGEACAKTVVLAITKDNIDTLPTLFKTYDTSASLDGCTVWQAARATSAATTFFKPIQIGRYGIDFIDAGFGYNNPCEVLIREAKEQFPDRGEMRVLSIGTGLGDVVSIKDTRTSILKALEKMATTSKKVALRLNEQYGDGGTYHRFNVERGLEDISLSDWERSSTIFSHTHNYLNENKRSIDKFIQAFARSTSAEHITNATPKTREAPQDERNTTVYSIPFPENHSFTGRTTIITALKQRLFNVNNFTKVALVGLGGAGKTQVALHLAHWAKHHEQGYSVFWIPAFSMAGFEQECVRLVTKLQIPHSKGEDAREVVQRHLTSGAIGKWFLIIDNADDIEILRRSTASDKGIFNFLPHHANGRILFTTRSREVAFAMNNQVVELSHMSFEEASELLEKLLDHGDGLWDIQSREKGTLARLFEVLTHLPLAISQAAAYMNVYKTTIADYIEICENTDERNMIQLLEQGCDDETYYDKSQSAVATTWIVSFDRIRSSNRETAKLLSFMAFIEPRAIPLSILPVLETEQQTMQAIGTLISHNLLAQRGYDKIYDMHRLVNLMTRQWIEDNGHSRDIRQMTLAQVNNVFPRHEWENHQLWRQYLPHALRLLRSSGNVEEEELAYLGFQVGRCLITDSRAKEAVGISEHVVKIGETIFEEDDPRKRTTKHQLAAAYHRAGQTGKALEILKNIVDIQEQILEEDDQNRLASQHELAAAYIDNDQAQQGVEILESVVEIRKRISTEDHPDRLASEHGLAAAYLECGQEVQAVGILESVVERQRALAEDHPDRLASEHELARAYLARGQEKQAVEILKSVVEIRRRSLPEDHPIRLASESNLARAYLTCGQEALVVKILESVVEIQKRTMAEDHPDRLTSQYWLAKAYVACGQLTQGIEMIEGVVEIEAKTLLDDDPRLQQSRDLLQSFYDSLEKSSQQALPEAERQL